MNIINIAPTIIALTKIGSPSKSTPNIVRTAKSIVNKISRRVKSSSRFEDCDRLSTEVTNFPVDVESFSINPSSLLDESLNSRIASLSGAGEKLDIFSHSAIISPYLYNLCEDSSLVY